MQEIYDLIEKVAATDSTVLVTGESGTGKEMAARAIHAQSPAGTTRSSPSTAPPCPRTSSRASSSATPRAPSPAPSRKRRGMFEAADARHALPGRGRRDVALDPGQAPPGPPGADGPAGRRQRRDPGRRPHHRRHQPGPEEAHRGGQVPRGALLPPERHLLRDAAPPEADRGHPPPRRPLPRRSTATKTGQAAEADDARTLSACSRPTPGRGTSASSRTSSSASWPSRTGRRSPPACLPLEIVSPQTKEETGFLFQPGFNLSAYIDDLTKKYINQAPGDGREPPPGRAPAGHQLPDAALPHRQVRAEDRPERGAGQRQRRREGRRPLSDTKWHI